MRRRIVVLGATGRTGRLVAAELSGTDGVLLVGRRTAELRRVGAETGLDVLSAGIDGLGGILVPGDVLLSCVGPYDLVGDTVVLAAIRAGVTYLDVAGEPAFLRRLHGPFGGMAEVAGVTLMPGVGHEFLPGQLLAEQAVAAAAGDVHAVEVAYLAEGGLRAGSASARRSLLRAVSQPTTTYRDGAHRLEAVATRRSSFHAGGRGHPTISIGGAEVWSIPRRHPHVRAVDVHTGWFGAAGPLVSLAARLSGPARLLALGRLLDEGIRTIGDGPESQLAAGTSRVVARVRDTAGTLVARRESVGGNPILLAARLAAGTADALADVAVRDLPPGPTDPVTALGLPTVEGLVQWAGMVTVT